MIEPIEVPSAGETEPICPSCGKTDRLLWPEGCNNAWHMEGMKIVRESDLEYVKKGLAYLASRTEGEARAFVEVISIRLGFGHAKHLAGQ